MKYFLRVNDLEHKFSRHSHEGGNPEHSNGKSGWGITCLFLLATALALGCIPPAFAQSEDPSLPFLRVEGNRFVDEADSTVILRGLSFSDPDRLENEGHWNEAYLEAAARWGANVVRFPVHPRAWRERGAEDYLRLLDEGITWAAEQRMYVIIDWHAIGNLRTEMFQHPMYNTTKTETFRFWKTIAERYAGNPTVAFYELFNEPTSYQGTLGRLTWDEHKAIMEDLIAMLYAHDRRIIPLIGGLDWAYDLSGVREAPIGFPGVAYVAHPYPQKRTPPWEAKWEESFGFVADRYPVIATELGFMSEGERGAHIPVIGDETYGEAIIAYFEEKGISWTPWVFDPVWSPQLIANWNFEPTRQGRFFRDKMMHLNARR